MKTTNRRCGALGVLMIITMVTLACMEPPDSSVEMTTQKRALRVDAPCILGDESVSIGGRTTVQGSVRSNNYISVEAGSTTDPTTVNGDLMARGKIILSGGTLVTGDVQSNHAIVLQQSYQVEGEMTAPFIELPDGTFLEHGDDPQFEYWPIPEREVNSGSETIVYGSWVQQPPRCNRILAPDQAYGNVTVHENCPLILVPGKYSLNELMLFSGSTLEIQGDGVVQVDVSGPVMFSRNTNIIGVDSPEDFQVYSNAWVRIENDVDFSGTITSPFGAVTVGSGEGSFNGCIHAQKVNFNPDGDVQQTTGFENGGSLSRHPITMDDLLPRPATWFEAENLVDYARLDKTKLTNGTVVVTACADHFPPCNSRIPNTPSGTLPSCFEDPDIKNVKDEYQAFYNLAQIVEQFNNAGMELNFELVDAQVPHRKTGKPAFDDAEARRADAIANGDPIPPYDYLYHDPVENNYGNIHVELIRNDRNYNVFRGNPHAIHWDDTTAKWVGSHGVGPVEYAMVLLPNMPTYMTCTEPIVPLPAPPSPSVVTLVDAAFAPGLGLVIHEVGHILGFTEQRLRRYPWSNLYALTGTAGLYDVGERHTGVITAYTDWWLNQVYEVRPGGDETLPALPGIGDPPVVTNPWRVHDMLTFRDPTAFDGHVFDMETFATYNPRHLRFDSESQSFVDCHTGRTPLYKVQFSEVGADANVDVFAQWTVENSLRQNLTKVTQQLNKTGTGNTFIGSRSQWAQWEWEVPLVISDTGTVSPGPLAHPVYVTVKALITNDATSSQPSDADDSQKMTVKLYPEDTTDLACRPLVLPESPLPAELEKFGASVTRLHNSRLVAVGAPGRAMNGSTNVGGVYLYDVEEPSIPANINRQGNALVPPDAGDQQQGQRMGVSVTTANINGTDIILAGAPWYDFTDGTDTFIDQGAVFVFTYDRGNNPIWSYLGRLDMPAANRSDNAMFGYSLTAVGSRLTVGAPGQSPPGNSSTNTPPASYVFTFDMNDDTNVGNWTKHANSPLQKPFGANFGWAVAENRERLLVGAPGFYDASPGAAYVYDYTDLTAAPEMLKPDSPICPDADITEIGDYDEYYPFPIINHKKENGDHFGSSVSINENVIAVGAPRHGYDALGDNFQPEAGAVYLFRHNTRHNGKWYWSAKLVPDTSDRQSQDHFGRTVHIGEHFREGLTRRTRTVVVGAPYHDYDRNGENYMFDSGAVFMFDLLENGNLKSTNKIDADVLLGTGSRGESDNFGLALDLMQGEPWGPFDMKTEFWHELLVGAPGASEVGWFTWGATPNRGTVSATSGNPHNAIDNDLTTVWDPTFPSWIQFDVGDDRVIEGFDIEMNPGCGYNIVVRGKGDKHLLWTDLFDQNVAGSSVTFPDRMLARHINIEVRSIVSGPGNCSGISELSLRYRTNW